jgi:uncharacterized damage-inducible protein DinB
MKQQAQCQRFEELDGSKAGASSHRQASTMLATTSKNCEHDRSSVDNERERVMKMNEFLLAELNREVDRSRRALEQVPEGKYDWKPHEKSMIFGYLADMVATIPSWVAMQVTKNDLDVAPADGSTMKQEPKKTSAALIQALDKSAADARAALEKTTDEHLNTNWQLKARGNVVQEGPRYAMIQDTINHWAHHRGQMTVYLRLMGAKVPALYGPSADDKNFR